MTGKRIGSPIVKCNVTSLVEVDSNLAKAKKMIENMYSEKP